MSELKACRFLGQDEVWPDANLGSDYYLKSEADKVIADLEESHKKEVKQLLILNREQANAANRLRDSMEQTIHHQKYKRCLAMYRYCAIKALYELDCKGNDVEWKWYSKWMHKWYKLAEKFKEAR